MYVTDAINRYKKTGVLDLNRLPFERNKKGIPAWNNKCHACRRAEPPLRAVSEEWVAQFIRVYADQEETIISKARTSVLAFARLTGWFSRKELDSASYENPDVYLIGPGLNTHRRTTTPFTLHNYSFELMGGFHVHADWYGDYGDLYGEWSISFLGDSVQEVRREQV